MKTFRIATYNVNSIRARLHIVIPWLQKNRPDVLCMQETKVDDTQFPMRDFEEAGYTVVFKGGKQYNGVAVASLEKPEEVSWGLDDDPPDTDRLIRCKFSNISVVNLYVPQGRERDAPEFQYKLRWFERLRKYIASHFSADDFLVCCGDMNVAREPVDVHDPKRLLGHVDFNQEVWGAFDQLKSWGLTDVFRKHHPDEPGHYAFFDYRVPNAVERGLGWRVDHILATPVLAEYSLNAFIDKEPRLTEKPSDHTVMVAEFGIAE
ncbi:MAG: exodeoxyribonuclease III [Syntrophobacterales bacterium]|nr:MAG: exodeoxyribonuclease III [Syntrophobacterales bacterium]